MIIFKGLGVLSPYCEATTARWVLVALTARLVIGAARRKRKGREVRCEACARGHEAKVCQRRRRLGVCGGVLTGSGSGGGEGNVVADGMSGKAGGVAWQALGIKKRGKRIRAQNEGEKRSHSFLAQSGRGTWSVRQPVSEPMRSHLTIEHLR
jgi:hypothetical protein